MNTNIAVFIRLKVLKPNSKTYFLEVMKMFFIPQFHPRL